MPESTIPSGGQPQPLAAGRDTDTVGPNTNRGSGGGGCATGDVIGVGDERALAEWAEKLDTTPQQLREAIAAVGDRAADIEMHLKGSHSTTNADRVEEAGDA